MNKVRQLISYIVFLAFIGLTGWSIYKLIVYVGSSSDPTIGAAIIAGCFTVIISIIGILVQKSKEQKINIQIEHRNKVAPIYEKFIDDIFNKVFYAEKMGQPRSTDQQLMEVMAEFTQKILVWGSNDVINAYNNFKESGNVAPGKPSHAILFKVEDLLLAIRKDLGHPTKGFKKGQLLQLFVNDINESIK